MSEQPSFFEKLNTWIRNSVTFKIISIAILILLMLIPTSMVDHLIRERKWTQEDVVREISSKWGEDQTVIGPVLTVPYFIYKEDNRNKLIRQKVYAHFLPEELKINGKILPEIRHRGIYEAVLYTTDLNVKGHFSYPDFQDWRINQKNILYDEAFLSIGVSDMRGINESIHLKWNKDTYQLGPGIPVKDVIEEGVSLKLNLSDSIQAVKKFTFSFNLKLNGSSYLNFVPLGKETMVHLDSKWANPSFDGQFLPDTHNITDKGFEADWKILQLNRNYPQQWTGSAFKPNNSSFGVGLMIGVDQYQKNTRTAKYAVLIIALTFVLFFFMEIINKKRIHPIQYLLVGFALSIFYVLLLAISEQSTFGLAYLVSSIAVIGLIVVYVHGMLKTTKLTALLSGSLVIIYGFVFIILQLQDYALLMGSIGLFIVLAIIMFFTRNIDWYNINKKSGGE